MMVRVRCLLLVALAVAPWSIAGAQTNLLLNGDAETIVSMVPVPNWNVTSAAEVVGWGTNGFPTVSSPGPATRGSNFFAGGVSTSSGLQQTIDLSSQAATIDAGGVPFTLCGFLGGFASQDDNAVVTATFLDGGADPMPTGPDVTIGPVLAIDRNFVSGLCLRSTSGTVPVGTRQVVVGVAFSNVTSGGPYNDGYADNLDFLLSATCPEVVDVPCVTTTTTSSTTTSSTTSSTSTTTSTSSSTSSTSTSSSTTTSSSTSSSTSTTTSTSTSTSTSSSTTLRPTTTTTLPAGCPTGATFDSIDCRLVALLEDVTTATDLGSLQAALAALVSGARERFAQVPTAGSQRKGRVLAKTAIRKVIAFAHRVRSNKGRKVIPSATRDRLTKQADDLRTDMTAYRKTL